MVHAHQKNRLKPSERGKTWTGFLGLPIAEVRRFITLRHGANQAVSIQSLIIHLLKGIAGLDHWTFYLEGDGHFVSHFPLKMSPSKFQRALVKANRTIYSSAQIIDALKQGRYADAKGKLFLKYQWKTIERIVLEYIPFLEDLERGLYDPDGNLRQDLLVERVRKNPKWTFQAGNQIGLRFAFLSERQYGRPAPQTKE